MEVDLSSDLDNVRKLIGDSQQLIFLAGPTATVADPALQATLAGSSVVSRNFVTGCLIKDVTVIKDLTGGRLRACR